MASSAAAQPDRTSLPIAPAPFTGSIAETAAASTPAPLDEVHAPEGAPNIFLFMSDDVGFAMASTFGGPVPTPNFDRLARTGQRYNRFHTTGLCSPMRAALLTGRNHHNVATGNLADLAIGYPGYNAQFPASTATIAQILRLNGYNTAMFGKHHNVLGSARGQMGPFDMWPTSLGFEYFFGFINGDTDQFRPNLIRGTSLLAQTGGKPPIFERRMADDALTWLRNQRANAPEKPFFVYYAAPGVHAPHQAPPGYIARFMGSFDKGWDAVREETYERQLAEGIIPAGAKLTERPANIPAWSTLSQRQKAIAARTMEVAAAMLAHQDEQVGRLLDEFDRVGVASNLLTVLLIGDNGSSSGGGNTGAVNYLQKINDLDENEEWIAANTEGWGGERTYPDYLAGWAWALNAPFPGFKANASRLGGIRNGMIVNWPGRVARPGSVCAEFGHVIDVTPTLLASAGLPAPRSVLGASQKPMDGQSLLPSLAGCQPGRARTQYFEMGGNLGLYQNGWFAGRGGGRAPRERMAEARPNAAWELYDLERDYSQASDVAAQHPERLRQMVELFGQEARRNNVYPLGAALAARESAGTRESGPIDFWGGDVSIPAMASRFPSRRSFELDAKFDLAKSRASGVVAALGSHFAGWSLHLDRGRPAFIYARSTNPGDVFQLAVNRVLPAGPTRLTLRYTANPDGSARARLFIGEAELGALDIPRTFSSPSGLGEQLDAGRDTGVGVTAYHTPLGELEGVIRHVRFTFGN